MSTRTFHLGDVLTVTTGRLVAPRHMDAVYELLDFMTGDTLFTHQLPRAATECAPELLRQHPDLGNVLVPEEFTDATHVNEWLAEQVERFGQTREVAPLPPGDHTHINPLTELSTMSPGKPVIVVEVEP